MGTSFVNKVRILQLSILGIMTISLGVYVVYISFQQPHMTLSLEVISSPTEFCTDCSDITEVEELHNMIPYSDYFPKVPDMARNNFTRQSELARASSKVCAEMGKNLRLLVVITSAPEHETARMGIRHTWGHFGARRDIDVLFLLGTSSNSTLHDNVLQEQYMYEDMVISDKFIDTYENLTLKTIFMLGWVTDNCPKAAFVLKTDDDMFINVPRLLEFISRKNPNVRALYGKLVSKCRPMRNKLLKYYISFKEYRPYFFPDFTTGPAYLLPARLSKELYEAALKRSYFKLEDVFLTGFVANDLKIKKVRVRGFYNTRVSLSFCKIRRGITIHMVNSTEQFEIWKKLFTGDSNCKSVKL